MPSVAVTLLTAFRGEHLELLFVYQDWLSAQKKPILRKLDGQEKMVASPSEMRD